MPECAICRGNVAQDEDHVEVEVTQKKIEDPDSEQKYFFHVTCSQRTMEGWYEHGRAFF